MLGSVGVKGLLRLASSVRTQNMRWRLIVAKKEKTKEITVHTDEPVPTMFWTGMAIYLGVDWWTHQTTGFYTLIVLCASYIAAKGWWNFARSRYLEHKRQAEMTPEEKWFTAELNAYTSLSSKDRKIFYQGFGILKNGCAFFDILSRLLDDDDLTYEERQEIFSLARHLISLAEVRERLQTSQKNKKAVRSSTADPLATDISKLTKAITDGMEALLDFERQKVGGELLLNESEDGGDISAKNRVNRLTALREQSARINRQVSRELAELEK